MSVLEGARWQNDPVDAVQVRVIVGDRDRFPRYWARELVGTERAAVRVTPARGEVFYLDDADGSGTAKVSRGGRPVDGHRTLEVDREVPETPTQEA